MLTRTAITRISVPPAAFAGLAIMGRAAVARVRRWIGRGARCAGQYGPALIGLLGIAILWTGMFYSLAVERRAAIDKAYDDTANYARALQEQITGVVRAIDQTLTYARASYVRAPDQFDISAWSRHGEFLTNPAFQLAIIGKDGFLRYSTLGMPAGPIDLSDREHVRFQAASTGDELYIGRPINLRLIEKSAIQFTRRIIAPDGSYAGVVSVGFDPSYLIHFYDSLDLGGDGEVVLVGTDGIIRARAPPGELALGQSLEDAEIMRSFARRPAGGFATASRTDGIRRIYSYRAVEGYPLLVAVGISESNVLAEWNKDQRTHIAMAIVVSLALLTVVASIILFQKRLRRSRQALKESEARHAEKSGLLDVTLQNMDQGIIKMDANQVVQVVNRRMAELFDLQDRVATGPHTQPQMLKLLWERGDYGDDDPDFATWFDRFTRSGGYGGDGIPYEMVRPNGLVIEVRGRSLPDGGAVQTFTDITERKQGEMKLRAARDEADRSSRAKAEFLAMMSHEIRSPMSGLLGIIELLRETPLAPDQLGMIEMVHGSAASLLRIVNDILDFSKMEAGRLTVDMEPVALRDLIASITEPALHAMAAKGLPFVCEIAGDVPAWLMLDPLRLRQILVNLLTNAVKFTAAGEVRLTVTTEAAEAGQSGPTAERILCFAVTDSGIGMSTEQLGRLFEPFSQADASTTKVFGGTGLGLTISRRLARLLDGDIGVESVPDRGSIFRLRLPLRRAAPVVAGWNGKQAAAPAQVCARRILVAEDQATNRWLIQHQLERLGCSVTAVENGRDALAALEDAEYDLLISDCHMPVTDGIALTRMIRAAEKARGGPNSLPILGLTADVSTEMRARCLAAGMTDVAGKPIDLRRLRAAIAGLAEPLLPAVADRPADTKAWGGEPDAAGGSDAEVVFEPAAYAELFAGDPTGGCEWLNAYLDSTAGLISGVWRCMAAGDRSELATNAHNLASASLAVGALRLGWLGRRLEAASAEGSVPELREMAEAVSAAWRDARRRIRGFVATLEKAA